MSLYSICATLVVVRVDTYFGNSHEYTQVNVQYPYLAISYDSYVSKLQAYRYT